MPNLSAVPRPWGIHDAINTLIRIVGTLEDLSGWDEDFQRELVSLACVDGKRALRACGMGEERPFAYLYEPPGPEEKQ